MLKGVMNNITGNTTTQVSSESNSPVQGKTPQAIKQQQMQQSTRDEIDTRFQDKATEELLNGMIGLVNDVEHKEPIVLYMFGNEISQIAAAYPDIKDCIKLDTKDIK